MRTDFRALAALSLCLGAGLPAQPRAPAAPPVHTTKRPMTVDDRFRYDEPGSPLISPDGQLLFYTSTRLSLDDNRSHVTTWLARADGSERPRAFLHDGDASPMWAPDSRSVYFFRAVATGTVRTRELFQQHVADTAATQRSHLGSHDLGVWRLSGDGSFFLIARDEDAASGPGATKDAVFVNEGSNGQVRYFWTNLWRFDLGTDSLTRVTHRDWSINNIDISPDGRAAVVEAQPDNERNTGWKTELYVVDLTDGSTRQVTHNQAPERNPHWFPDGRRVLFNAVRLDRWENGNGDLWQLDIASGATLNLTPTHTGRFVGPVFSPDDSTIYVGSGYGTARFPVRIDVASGRITPLMTTAGTVAGSWSADRRTYAYRSQDDTSPPDIYVRTVGGTSTRPVRISDMNPWIRNEIALGPVSVVRWRSADGMPIEGLLTMPPADSGARPRPLLVHVPCGPGCGWVNEFSLKNQIYAGLGYVQLSAVVRGSNNYDDLFMQANYFDLGGGDLRDVLSGVDSMIARRIASADSLALDGWSYGAILGGYILTQTKRFKAASLGAMVSDWSADYGSSAYYSGERWFFGGTPWTNPKWRERSSLTYADRVTTPTLLHHGDLDETDLPFQTMNFFAALERHGTIVRYIRYPDEGHDLRQPQHIRLRDSQDVAWMQRFVRGIRGTGEDRPPELR